MANPPVDERVDLSCRICLGGDGSGAVLRRRCACEPGWFHDRCLSQWIESRVRGGHGSAAANCEVCRRDFIGVLLERRDVAVRPAVIIGAVSDVFRGCVLVAVGWGATGLYEAYDASLPGYAERQVATCSVSPAPWRYKFVAYGWAAVWLTVAALWFVRTSRGGPAATVSFARLRLS